MTTIILALCIIPRTDVAEDRCDIIWVDHFYLECGKKNFTQIIFVDYVDGPGLQTCEEIVAWRMSPTTNERPFRTSDGYCVLFRDGDRLRRVSAPYYRETWSQTGASGDPELLAREYLPPEQRRGLRGEKP